MAYDVIVNDIYVDDCLSGCDTEEERSTTVDQFSLAVAKGGFKLKGFTFSGLHSPENLANDDRISVTVGGTTWYPKDDDVCLKISGSKRKRPKKSNSDKLVRRDCVSVVYGIYDPRGLVAPILCSFKIDLNELTILKLDWDDVIPENLRQIWDSNFEMSHSH